MAGIAQLLERPRRTGSYSFAFDPNEHDAWKKLDAEAARLERLADGVKGDDKARQSARRKASAARRKATVARDKIAHVTFYFEALPVPDLERLREKHPPTEQQLAEWEDAREQLRSSDKPFDPGPLTVDVEAFRPALIAACVTRVDLPDGSTADGITEHEINALVDNGWNNIEIGNLFQAVSTLHGSDATLEALGKG